MKQIINIFFIITFFVSCDKPQIELLCRKHKNEKFTEIYLVKNRPHDPQKLQQLMHEFNNDLKDSRQYGQRIFLKPHENGILGIVFNDIIDYSKNGCKELDNMDFIYRVTKNRISGEKRDTVIYYMFNE